MNFLACNSDYPCTKTQSHYSSSDLAGVFMFNVLMLNQCFSVYAYYYLLSTVLLLVLLTS